MAGKKKMKVRPLEERLRIAKEINAARAAAPRELIANVLKKFPGISESNYWAWNKRLELAEAHRAANNGMEEQHFPLAVIPPKPVKKQYVKKQSAPVEDNRDLVAQLLEVASKLLKR